MVNAVYKVDWRELVPGAWWLIRLGPVAMMAKVSCCRFNSAGGLQGHLGCQFFLRFVVA